MNEITLNDIIKAHKDACIYACAEGVADADRYNADLPEWFNDELVKRNLAVTGGGPLGFCLCIADGSGTIC
jgi:hypothetical protein